MAVCTVGSGGTGGAPWPQDELATFQTMSIGHGAERVDEIPHIRPRTRDTINVHDIDGASPNCKVGKLIANRPDLYNNADIAGSQSMRLHRQSNKPDRSLNHSDIEGSKPRREIFFRTSRRVDPLNPRYALPSYEDVPPEIPRFIRDSYCVDDIQGTRSSQLYPRPMRSNYGCEDIEGARSTTRHPEKMSKRDLILDVSDIAGQSFRTSRVTNPLEPTYFVNGAVVHNDDPKSKPRGAPTAKNTPFYSLYNADVMRPVTASVRPLLRETNYVGDIPGAQADTVSYAFRTNRQVNPLDPEYTNLDGEIMRVPRKAEYHMDMTLSGREGNCETRMLLPDGCVEIRRRSSSATTRSTATAAVSKSGRTSSSRGSSRQYSSHHSSRASIRAPCSEPPASSQGSCRGYSRCSEGAPADHIVMRSSNGAWEGRVGCSSSRGSLHSDRRGRSSGSGSGSVDRLVLRSSDGTLRVPPTPAERRQSSAYEQDIQSVRDLL
jgi:hypothetical protein